nr:unnamed protein product [Spirometra erinaceieuropaei]
MACLVAEGFHRRVQGPQAFSPNLERYNPPPPPPAHTNRHPAPMSSNVLQRTSSHQTETTNNVTNIGSLPTDRLPNQQEKLLEIVQTRAIVSFRDTTFRSSLSFLKDEIICVFVDSMTSSTGYTPASRPTSLSTLKTDRVREGSGGWLQRSSYYAWM